MRRAWRVAAQACGERADTDRIGCRRRDTAGTRRGYCVRRARRGNEPGPYRVGAPYRHRVYARSLADGAISTISTYGELSGRPIGMGDRINPGDWIVADRNGAVVVPSSVTGDVARKALECEAADVRFVELLRKGLSLDEARMRVDNF